MLERAVSRHAAVSLLTRLNRKTVDGLGCQGQRHRVVNPKTLLMGCLCKQMPCLASILHIICPSSCHRQPINNDIRSRAQCSSFMLKLRIYASLSAEEAARLFSSMERGLDGPETSLRPLRWAKIYPSQMREMGC